MIKTPKGETTRPTSARLRQALFNSLQTLVSDARVLDLFAGSGGLGFEALSWGAARVVFVEESRPAVKLIQANAADLGISDRIELLAATIDPSQKLVRNELVKLGPFDLILADPPYSGGWETKLIEGLPWDQLLTESGVFCLEWGNLKSKVDALPDQTDLLVKVREKNYGDSVLTTYSRKS
jgi:16S rRNA (guanine966-N2)-methyltransferase